MRKIFVAAIAASFATLSMGVFAAADKVDCKKLEGDKNQIKAPAAFFSRKRFNWHLNTWLTLVLHSHSIGLQGRQLRTACQQLNVLSAGAEQSTQVTANGARAINQNSHKFKLWLFAEVVLSLAIAHRNLIDTQTT